MLFSAIHYTLDPRVIYFSPELAIVDLSATELKQQGIECVSCRLHFMVNGRIHCNGETDDYIELVAAPDSIRVLWGADFRRDGFGVDQSRRLYLDDRRQRRRSDTSLFSSPPLVS